MKRSDIQFYILATSAALALITGAIYEQWNLTKPMPEIPIQSWEKYVKLQKTSGKDEINRCLEEKHRKMSQTGPFIRVNTVSAPLKGSFPLDHEGTCKLEMLNYMVCLHEKKQQNSECRNLAKLYFSCRMENGLMDKDEWKKLGYGE